MTFYNHIESARYEMFRLVNDWTNEGSETKARISGSLDKARREYAQKESENERLRELVVRIWNAARLMDANSQIDGMRITDDLREECERAFKELGIEVR